MKKITKDSGLNKLSFVSCLTLSSKYLLLGALTLTSSVHSSGFGGNSGCNDWPEWTPMYWMEKMMGDDDCYNGPGYGYGGYSPVSGYGSSYSPVLGSGYLNPTVSPNPYSRSAYNTYSPYDSSYNRPIYRPSYNSQAYSDPTYPFSIYNSLGYSHPAYHSSMYDSHVYGSAYPQRDIKAASYMPSPEEVYASDVKRRRLAELSNRRVAQGQRQYPRNLNSMPWGGNDFFSSNRGSLPFGASSPMNMGGFGSPMSSMLPMNMGGFGSPMSSMSPMNMGGFGSPMSTVSPMSMGGFGSPMPSMGMNPLSQGMMRPF